MIITLPFFYKGISKMRLHVFHRSSHSRCSIRKVILKKKFRQFHMKAPVLESLFNKVAGLCKIFKNTYFWRTFANHCPCPRNFRMTFPLINNPKFLKLNVCCLSECYIKLVKKQWWHTEALDWGYSVKNVFLKFSQH